MTEPATNGGASFVVGEKMINKMEKMLFACGRGTAQTDLQGTQRKKGEIDALRNVLKFVPNFVAVLLSKKIREYRSSGNKDKEGRLLEQNKSGEMTNALGEYSYCCIISLLEKGDGLEYRFTSSTNIIDEWCKEFNIQHIEAFSGMMLLLLMARVSYMDISQGNHPLGVTHDWKKLSSHNKRDDVYCHAIQASAKMVPWGDLYSNITFHIRIRDKEREMLCLVKTCSLGKSTQQGGCYACFKDVAVNKTKALSTITSRCADGVWHTPFGEHCSYVCNYCNKPGHYRKGCPKEKEAKVVSGVSPVAKSTTSETEEAVDGPVGAEASVNAATGLTTVVMEVLAGKVGALIGTRGAIIQEIQTRSGCKIIISQRLPAGMNRTLTLTGTAAQVKAADEIVRLILAHGFTAIHINTATGSSYRPKPRH